MAPSAPDLAQQDQAFMRLALQLAADAAAAGEVPVGAVVVRDGVVIGTGRNSPVADSDPCAHAEIQALRVASAATGNYRLDGCTLYVTLEPCAMCCGAILHGRIRRVVYGAADPKTGCAGSVLNLFDNFKLNHQTTVEGGLLAVEAGQSLQSFFKSRRTQHREQAIPLREDALRTPDICFDALAELPWPSRYRTDLPSLAGLRMHYLDPGPVHSTTAYLVLHPIGGWSYCYRHAVPTWLGQGARVVLPDLIGFGRSDKPKRQDFHTLDWHARCLQELLLSLDVEDVVLLAPEAAHPLIQPLMALPHVRFTQLVLQAPPTELDPVLEREILQAPFPDAGYRAALRAFYYCSGPVKFKQRIEPDGPGSSS
jgi:tRNA(adenine34) deaminase